MLAWIDFMTVVSFYMHEAYVLSKVWIPANLRKLHEQPQKQRLEMVILNLRQTLSIHDFDYQRHLEAQHLAITWIMKRPGNGYDIYRFINLLSCKALFRFLRVVVVIYIVFKNSNKLIAISCYFSQSLSLIYKQLSESADVQKAEKLILVEKTSDQEVTSLYPTTTREYFQRAHYVRKEGSKVLKKSSTLAFWLFGTLVVPLPCHSTLVIENLNCSATKEEINCIKKQSW